MTDKKPKATVVDPTGLRYRSKAAGSRFSSPTSFTRPTLSCFRCGKHRLQEELEGKRILGSSRPVCKGGCIR